MMGIIIIVGLFSTSGLLGLGIPSPLVEEGGSEADG